MKLEVIFGKPNHENIRSYEIYKIEGQEHVLINDAYVMQIAGDTLAQTALYLLSKYVSDNDWNNSDEASYKVSGGRKFYLPLD